ncbi:MAG: NHL repeat-containing protein [bacterium]
MRNKIILICCGIIFLLADICFCLDDSFRLSSTGYIEVDRKGNIWVKGYRQKRYYPSILKLSKEGKLISSICEELYDTASTITSGAYFFKARGMYHARPDEKTFLDDDGAIYFKRKEDVKNLFGYLRTEASINNLLERVIHPSKAIINSKGQLCVLGTGLEKVKLPLLIKGRVKKRDNGEIIYEERYEPRLAILDREDGHPIKVFGKPGVNKGEIVWPLDIAVDSKDNMYITDSRRGKVLKFDSEGNFVREWGKWGSGDGEFKDLHAIDIDKKSDTIYVTESYIHSAVDPYEVSQYRVQKFDSEGNFLGRWGGDRITGVGLYWFAPVFMREYDLREPKSIAIAPDGMVWLIESWRASVSKFSPDGELLLRFGGEGDINGDSRGLIGSYSEGIAVGPDGTVYVCDNGRRKGKEGLVRIVKYDSNGKYLGEIKGD